MRIEVRGYNADRADAIRKAAEQEWDWGTEWREHVVRDAENPENVAVRVADSYGESNLTGGESEDEFAWRVQLAIWKANGAFCEVNVTATYLEDLPCETYLGGENEYEKALKEGLLVPNDDDKT